MAVIFFSFGQDRSLDRPYARLPVIIQLLINNDFILSFVQPYARYVKRLLRAGVPIATDIDAIDENNALSPILHIDKRIAGIGQMEGSLVENRLIPQRRYLGEPFL